MSSSDDDLLRMRQPVCEVCWYKLARGHAPELRGSTDLVNCCLCGSFTQAGIWVAIDPERVPYPYTRRRS